jgi:hypothetical protein
MKGRFSAEVTEILSIETSVLSRNVSIVVTSRAARSGSLTDALTSHPSVACWPHRMILI